MRYFIPFISLSLVFQGCGNEESLAKEETSISSTKVNGPARGDSQNVPRPHDNRNSNLSPGLNRQAAEPSAQTAVSEMDRLEKVALERLNQIGKTILNGDYNADDVKSQLEAVPNVDKFESTREQKARFMKVLK